MGCFIEFAVLFFIPIIEGQRKTASTHIFSQRQRHLTGTSENGVMKVFLTFNGAKSLENAAFPKLVVVCRDRERQVSYAYFILQRA